MHRIFVLFLFLLVRLISFANNKVQISPEPGWIIPVKLESGRTPDFKDVSNGSFYELMNHQINLVNQTVYLHFIRHIINESGVQEGSEVSVNFAPQFQQLIFHKVEIIRNGEIMNRLEKSSVKLADEESGAPDFEYNGIKRAYLILKDVQKGDLIDVSYSVVGFNPVFEGRYSGDFYFSEPTPIANYYLGILAQPERKLNFKMYNQAESPVEQLHGNLKIYQWNNPKMRIGSPDSDIPSWYNEDPRISVSEFENWKQVADWGLRIFGDYSLPLPESLLSRMDVWRKEAKGDRDMFANLALRFVQDQIRYLGLEIGSYTHRPHTPEKVYDLRFGDCKDKALLLATILNHENITAYVALTNTAERENLNQWLPSTGAFNHAIVAIKRSEGYIFVDPTISMQRGELINAYIPAYGYGLVLKPGVTELETIEPEHLNYSSVIEDFRLKYADSTQLEVTSVYEGGAADDIRNNLTSVSHMEAADSYLNWYNQAYEGIVISAPFVSSDDSLKNEVTLNEFYTIPSLWHKTESGEWRVDLYGKLIASKIPDPKSHLKADPLAIDFPLAIQYMMKFDLPEEIPVDITPLHIKNDSYQFDFTLAINGNQQTFSYYFKTFRDFIPADDIKQYKSDYKDMEKCFGIFYTRTGISPPVYDNKYDSKPVTNINWVTVWLCFFFGVLFTMLFRFLNKISKTTDQRSYAAQPLQGWIIVLGVLLMVRLAIQCYVFYSRNYFLKSAWVQLEQTGGVKLHTLFIFEMFVSILSMVGAGSLLYWFFGKRDIFPSMFIYYSCLMVGAQLVLLIVYYSISLPVNLGSIRSDMTKQFFRMLVYAAICVSFLLRSEQVKQTFVYPPG